MRKFLFSLFLFCFFIFNADNVFACSCELPSADDSVKRQVRKAYEKSTAVFIGEVIEIIKQPDVFFVEVKLRVNNSWKNKLSNEVIIRTGQDDGDCGYRFKVGEKYLVYAYGESDLLGTNICQRTSLLSSTEDIKFLEKIKKSKKN